jgi:hypothetical protein
MVWRAVEMFNELAKQSERNLEFFLDFFYINGFFSHIFSQKSPHHTIGAESLPRGDFVFLRFCNYFSCSKKGCLATP